jgi:hypothetical protein
LRKHLSYANVTATIAVFLALGGTAIAAKVLIKKPSQLKNGVVINKKVRKATLTVNRLRPSARASLRGQTGPPGEAKAYAQVTGSTGLVVADRTKDVESAKEGTGQYCIKVPFTPNSIVAMHRTSGSVVRIAQGGTNGYGTCASLLPGTNAFVIIKDTANAFTDADFYVMVN